MDRGWRTKVGHRTVIPLILKRFRRAASSLLNRSLSATAYGVKVTSRYVAFSISCRCWLLTVSFEGNYRPYDFDMFHIISKSSAHFSDICGTFYSEVMFLAKAKTSSTNKDVTTVLGDIFVLPNSLSMKMENISRLVGSPCGTPALVLKLIPSVCPLVRINIGHNKAGGFWLVPREDNCPRVLAACTSARDRKLSSNPGGPRAGVCDGLCLPHTRLRILSRCPVGDPTGGSWVCSVSRSLLLRPFL